MSKVKFAVHPGRILREEYLEPLGLSPGKLAKALGLPRTRIERLAREETAVSVDTALRLAKAFNTRPNFWLNLQSTYDLNTADPKAIENVERIIA